MMLCPSADVLNRVAAGESVVEWTNHIEDCAECQAALERITDDAELRRWRPTRGSDTQDDSEYHRVRRRLLGERTDHAADVPLSFLKSPRRPGDLGALAHYDIECELGRGGMGVVLRGHDPELNRRVAIKVIRPGADDAEARNRLIREARALARLEHINIVKVHAIGETETGLPFLVLEYVAGHSLAQKIDAGKALPARVAAELVAGAADGLHVAHQAGLIHRDVKPGNILLHSANDEAAATPKVTDFGLVRAAESTMTGSGMLAGTPAYMSPEQIRDPARIDTRADVYGLGATLYECLTGDVPFRGSSAMVLRQVIDDEPRPPRRLNESVPRDLEIICLKALAKEPNSRYQSAAEFAADLRRYLAGEPIHARPAGRVERTIRWSRRKPLPAALAAALVLVGLLGVGGVIWQWRIAMARATEAEDNLQDAARAVDQFLTRVSEDKLMDSPGFEPLRKQLLEDALTYYQRLLLKRGAGPAMRIETAKAAVRAAGLVTILRPGPDQVAAWERAIACWEDCPRSSEHRDEWLKCQLNLAIAMMGVNRFDDGLTLVEKLQPEIIARADNRPDHVPYQRDLAGVIVLAGDLHNHAGRMEQARAAYAQGQKAFERLLQLDPNSVRDLRRLSVCLTNWALSFSAEQALPLHDQALAVQQRALDQSKNAPEDLRQMGRIEHYRGVALTELKRPEEARAAIASACRHLQQLCDASPDVIPYRLNLASALHWLGSAQFDAKLPEAAATFARAKSEYERLLAAEPTSEKYRKSLAGIDAFQKSIAALEKRK